MLSVADLGILEGGSTGSGSKTQGSGVQPLAADEVLVLKL